LETGKLEKTLPRISRISRIGKTFQPKDAETQRGRAATKGILQKETKETKSEKNFAKNAQFPGMALQRRSATEAQPNR
jgi:hypothetical protein